MSALGVPTYINRTKPLSRFQMYLGLADALACKQHSDSGHLSELADSFGHDVLNLAALAGRLLWYEGVTPEIWRSHDVIAVSVDSESYYVMLQSACDIMADVIVTLGAKKKGQAPSESFHKLNEWAPKNLNRLDPAYHMVAANLPWFGKINSTRTGFIHRGKKMVVYTDRVTFNWGKLIPTFKSLTQSVLEFSERLSLVVTSNEERQKSSRKKIIDGVYVPALHHLLKEYEVPQESEKLGSLLLARKAVTIDSTQEPRKPATTANANNTNAGSAAMVWQLKAITNRAQSALDKEDYRTAVDLCTRVISLSPGDQSCIAIRQHAAIKLADQYVDESTRCWEKGDFEKALQWAERALELDPANKTAVKLKNLATQMKKQSQLR